MEELGFYIVWQSGEKYIDDIIKDISEKFNILDAISLHWDKESIAKNLNMLYPHREFNNNSAKVKEIGRTDDGVRLHTIIVLDANPDIVDQVNINFKNIKDNYRKKYKTNFLHAADNEKEASDNIRDIFNGNFSDIRLKELKKQFIVFDKFNLELIKSDIVLFDNIQEVFKLLNENINYVVLRGWQKFNNLEKLIIGDVDILTDNYYYFIAKLNAKKTSKLSYKVQHKVKIKDKEVLFDIQYVGDNYFDANWQNDMLKKKEYKEFYYTLDQINYYYSLLYAALIFKPFRPQKYKEEILSLKPDEISMVNLKNFLNLHNYKIKRPNDRSVYYRYSLKHLKYIILKVIGLKK